MFVRSFVRPSVRPSVRSQFVQSSYSSSFGIRFFRMTSGQSQISLRSVSGQSQGSLRSVSGLSMLTSSNRRSLKYFVLLFLGTRSQNKLRINILSCPDALCDRKSCKRCNNAKHIYCKITMSCNDPNNSSFFIIFLFPTSISI